MQKQIVLRGDVIKNLDRIREDHNCSYNTAIDYLLKKEPHDLRLLEINNLFERLGTTVPEDMSMMVEVFRNIVVRTYLLNPTERSENRDSNNDVLEKLIHNMLGGKSP